MGRATTLVCLLVAGALAAGEVPVFVMEPGRPVEARYADGRVAEYRIMRRAPVAIPIAFSVTENDCVDKTGEKGRLLFGFLGHHLRLVWKEHPDPAKSGQPVTIVADGGQIPSRFPIVDEVLITIGNKQHYPKAAAGLPAETIEADDFSWLPGERMEPPESITFSRWDSEVMFTNSETGLMENRTVPIAMGARFAKKGPRALELAGIKHFLGSEFSFFFGDLWAIIIERDGGFCQLSLKATLSEVINDVIAYLGQQVALEPYLFDSDEHSHRKPNTFNAYFSSPGTYHVE